MALSPKMTKEYQCSDTVVVQVGVFKVLVSDFNDFFLYEFGDSCFSSGRCVVIVEDCNDGCIVMDNKLLCGLYMNSLRKGQYVRRD